MEFSQLISFFHVARLNSVSKASEVVCRSQPAISQQIKALEEELGCKLLHRIGKRKLFATDEGKRLLSFAKNLLYEMDHVLDDIHAISGGERGRVSISAPFTTCFQILPAVLKAFKDHYPNIIVSVFDRPQADAVAMVRNGEVDFAIALETAVSRGLHTVFWKRVVPVLMVPKGHALVGHKKITIETLSGQTLIAPPARRRHPGWLLLDKSAREAGRTLSVGIESTNVEFSSRLVEKGLGISFATIVEDASFLAGRNLDIVPLAHILPGGNLVVAMRNESSLGGARANFIETLLNI